MRTMMKKGLLFGVLIVVKTCLGQSILATPKAGPICDIGVMYSSERSTLTSGRSFWLQGGSAEVAFPLYKNFGVAMNVTGAHSGDLGTGLQDFSKLSFLAGPRYTIQLHRYRVFGESLFGGIHGFDAVFPSSAGAQKSANAFAMQAGGGFDIDWKKHVAIRLIEASYIRTQLPNGGNNLQNDLKLGAGIVFRLPVF